MFFFGFAMKFQKNLVFFDVLGSNSKKNLEFSKIPKFQKKLSTCPNVFWNFWILENSRSFWNCKGIGQKEVGITFSFYWQCLNRTKTLYQLLFDLFPYNSKKTSSFPKFQTSKKFFGKLIIFFGILEFWKTRGFFGIWSQNIKKHKVFFGIS